jgi:hypothetical protein
MFAPANRNPGSAHSQTRVIAGAGPDNAEVAETGTSVAARVQEAAALMLPLVCLAAVMF